MNGEIKQKMQGKTHGLSSEKGKNWVVCKTYWHRLTIADKLIEEGNQNCKKHPT